MQIFRVNTVLFFFYSMDHAWQNTNKDTILLFTHIIDLRPSLASVARSLSTKLLPDNLRTSVCLLTGDCVLYRKLQTWIILLSGKPISK